MEILLGILILLSLINSALIFSIGLFLVRLRDRVNMMFADTIEAMGVVHGAIPEMPEIIIDTKVKTWDEKYEEELDYIAKRMREGSGLRDLTDSGVSWGDAPPAPNAANSQDLIIKDV